MKAKTVATVAVAGLGAAILRKRLLEKTATIARPCYPDFCPEDVSSSLFEVVTEDGVTLRGKRYSNEGAMPVILMAGFAGNGFNYDLAFEDCNMALYLARRGFDVWIANFRGTGREPYKSDRTDTPHSIEDVAVYDAPALAAAVTERTGKKPVLVGHSMGGVICYGFLQGLKYVGEGGARRLEPDAELCRKRNDQVAAVVSVAGPTTFRWPVGSKSYWLMGSPPMRLLFSGLRPILKMISTKAPHVPIELFITTMLKVAPRTGQAILRLALVNFVNLNNTTPETFVEAIISGGSDVSFIQTYQLVDAIVEQDFTGLTAVEDTGSSVHNFSKSMDTITAPILFVAAENDAVDYRVLYSEGYEKVSSDVKDYKCFIDFGHLDLLLGTEACRTVFPYVADWLEKIGAK